VGGMVAEILDKTRANPWKLILSTLACIVITTM
jgi:hypothetical protein